VNAAPDARAPEVPDVTDLSRLRGSVGAAVYRGRRIGTDRSVAVKILPIPFDATRSLQFQREQERISRLTADRTILPVEEIGTLADGRVYLITELCAQSCAERLFREGPFAAASVVALGRRLAAALYRVHALGVVHGAITPYNVLFRADGDAVLADVGAVARTSYAGDPEGYGPFAAPETLRTGTRSAATDLYGLGATLYMAVSGRPPFPVRIDEAPSDRVRRVITEPAPPADAAVCGRELATLLAELLATTPENRPSDAADVAARLAPLVAPSRPTEPPAPTPPSSATEPAIAPVVTPPMPTAVDSGDPDDDPRSDRSTDWARLLDDVLCTVSSFDDAVGGLPRRLSAESHVPGKPLA
jgi:serine/threonine protein kinase